MLKMIKYNLKKRSLLILITTIVVLAIGFAMFIGEDFLREYYVFNKLYGQEYYATGPDSGPLMFITIIACILCTLIPILEFSFKMSKVSIDQMYSIPIKRDKLYIAKFISGFIEILIPVLTCYIFCLLKVLSTDHMYNLIHFLPYLGCLLFFMFILYATIAFFFTRGNTVVDGIMNILFIVFLFEIFVAVMDNVFRLPYPDTFISTYFDSGYSFLYSPICLVTNIFNNKLSIDALTEIFGSDMQGNYYLSRIILIESEVVSIVVFTIIGIVSSVLFVKLNKEDKAEDSMQISNSWFSYKTMIPLYFSMICLLMSEDVELIGFIFLFVGVYIAYVIYRRNLKIKKWDIIVTGICFVAMIIIYVLYKDYKDGLPPLESTPHIYNIIKLLN